MPHTTVALVGRPNVGKSTLFNRLTKSRDALVANLPGLTRDRQYGFTEFGNKRVSLVDTGGLSSADEGVDALMADQSLLAVEESDIIFFLVDARDGLTSEDELIARHLRTLAKPTIIVVNKTDGLDPDIAMAPFYSTGFDHLIAIAASQGRGVRQLISYSTDVFSSVFDNANEVNTNTTSETDSEESSLEQAEGSLEQAEGSKSNEEANLAKERRIKMAIIGRPNVGKSTLVNRMLGEDRVVVFDMPGTTRDSVYIDFERQGKRYTVIDTAGVRRRKNVKETVEKFSIVKTLQAINDANVVILLIDATEALVDQDLHLLSQAIESGRALVLAVNKWDGLSDDQKKRVNDSLSRKLRFIDYADLHYISALHGSGVGKLYQSIESAYAAATDKLATPRLTKLLEAAVREHQPPLINGRRIKLRYAHSGGRNPPVIVIHGNQTNKVPGHYQRFLEKFYRRALDLHGTPLKIEFRGNENPYAEKKKPRSSGRKVSKH